jgi:hypothetical protein
MSLTKQDIITNWDSYYKLYLKLNPDLEYSGIITKRALLNHFVKYGYDEGRKVIESNNINFNIIQQTQLPVDDIQVHKPVNIQVKTPVQVHTQNLSKFNLEERMIIEKLD